MKNLNKITLELDMYNACRTNTGRAYSNETKHYNLPFLAQISGARFEDTLTDLDWCAKIMKPLKQLSIWLSLCYRLMRYKETLIKHIKLW